MDVGIIGLSRDGEIVARQLLGKTASNLFVYDPDGRSVEGGFVMLSTAAELCERCDRIILALESAADLTAFCNGTAEYIRADQIFIDLTDISPALAHAVANGMRRRGATYIDCGIFGRDGLAGDFLSFAGGTSRAFAKAFPLIRCFAPGCRYMGPSGRGKAVRLLCRALTARLGEAIEETVQLGESFGIERDYLLDTLGGFEATADPLALLGGGAPLFTAQELAQDTAIADEMARRAGLFV